MHITRRSPLPALAAFFACVLAFRVYGSLSPHVGASGSDFSFHTVVVSEPDAPASLRDCTSRYDGRITQQDVRLVNLSRKPIATYAVRWLAIDRAGDVRSKMTASYLPPAPVPRFAVATGHSSLDLTAGVKLSLIDHITCRITRITYAGGGWHPG